MVSCSNHKGLSHKTSRARYSLPKGKGEIPVCNKHFGKERVLGESQKVLFSCKPEVPFPLPLKMKEQVPFAPLKALHLRPWELTVPCPKRQRHLQHWGRDHESMLTSAAPLGASPSKHTCKKKTPPPPPSHGPGQARLRRSGRH